MNLKSHFRRSGDGLARIFEVDRTFGQENTHIVCHASPESRLFSDTYIEPKYLQKSSERTFLAEKVEDTLVINEHEKNITINQ